jgi:hypothetical protein
MHPRSLKILWCCLGQRFSPRFYTKSAFLASRCEENRVLHKRSCVATRLLGKKITTLPMLVLRSCRQRRRDCSFSLQPASSCCSSAPLRAHRSSGGRRHGGSGELELGSGAAARGGRRPTSSSSARGDGAEGGGTTVAGELQLVSGVAAHGGRQPPASSSLAQGRRRAKGSFSYGESPSH